MDREPDCFWICLLNSMFHMTRNRHIVALFHPHEISSLEFQGRFPAHHHDPFVLILIVPKTERAAVRLRNDTLDLDEGFSNRLRDCSDLESSGRFANKLSIELSFHLSAQ